MVPLRFAAAAEGDGVAPPVLWLVLTVLGTLFLLPLSPPSRPGSGPDGP
jgi:hypothetical protein